MLEEKTFKITFAYLICNLQKNFRVLAGNGGNMTCESKMFVYPVNPPGVDTMIGNGQDAAQIS
jgi:hypothetical protein